MPKQVDREAKRVEFVDAAWRVIRRDGLSAATLRRVASEARCTTGALTHYFDNREALLVHALRVAHVAAGTRMAGAVRSARSDGQRLEAIVLLALPLDAQRMGEWRTHLAFWGEAADNPRLREENARRFGEWADLLDRYLKPIVREPKSRRRESLLLMGLIDGLALRLMLQAKGSAGTHVNTSTIISDVRFYLRELQRRSASMRRR